MNTDSKLADFARQALAHGRDAVQQLGHNDGVNVRLGDSGFVFFESEPYLAPSVRYCLNSTSPAMNNNSKACVYADYTGWHVENQFRNLLADVTDILELCQKLERFDIQANYYAPLQRWDIYDRSDCFGIRLQTSPDASPEWEETAPLANFCNWIGASFGLTMLHAASIGTLNAGILLVGEGGAGKSGTTLGAMLEGLQSAGDDYTMLSTTPDYKAHAVYQTVKQDPDGLARLGLSCQKPLNWQGKIVCRTEELLGAPICQSIPVNALVMPEIGASRTTFEAVDSSAIFKILTFSTLRQLGTSHSTVFRTCAKLVRELPCYKMKMSSKNEEISAGIKGFLERSEFSRC